MRTLDEARDEILELFISFREQFDNSEYQQGVKDGLRKAMAILGDPKWLDYTLTKIRVNETHLYPITPISELKSLIGLTIHELVELGAEEDEDSVIHDLNKLLEGWENAKNN